MDHGLSTRMEVAETKNPLRARVDELIVMGGAAKCSGPGIGTVPLHHTNDARPAQQSSIAVPLDPVLGESVSPFSQPLR